MDVGGGGGEQAQTTLQTSSANGRLKPHSSDAHSPVPKKVASSTGDTVQAEVVTMKKTDMDMIRAMIEETINRSNAEQQANLTTSLMNVMQTQVGEVKERMAKCEDRVERLDTKVTDQALDLRDLKQRLDKVQEELAMSKAQAPPPSARQVLAEDEWNRSLEPNVLRINSGAMVGKSAVGGAFAELAASSGIEKKEYELESRSEVSRNFVVRFTGELRAASRRAAKILGSLKGATGEASSSRRRRRRAKACACTLGRTRTPAWPGRGC